MKSSGPPKEPSSTSPITDFNGYYEFLNNDFPTWIYYEGSLYPSVSTAFQAARTSDR